jgi:outer membrane protein assembly factor BamD (BamD/ComL family)
VHARRWPHGALEQEREILLIQALARQGDGPEARARAQRFLRRFPDSTLAATARSHVSD